MSKFSQNTRKSASPELRTSWFLITLPVAANALLKHGRIMGGKMKIFGYHRRISPNKAPFLSSTTPTPKPEELDVEKPRSSASFAANTSFPSLSGATAVVWLLLMGHYQPSNASYATYHEHVELNRGSPPSHNQFEFTFTVESKIKLYQPPKHECDHLQAQDIGWRDDPENPFDHARSVERPSSPVPWAFGDNDEASIQGVDPLLLQLEDESLAMNRMGYLDDSDDSLRDPFESQPLVPQPRNPDVAIDFARNMLDEGEQGRNESADRRRAQLQYVIGSPRRARHFSEEQVHTKGLDASLRRKVLLRNTMMDECVRRDGSPLALTQTLRNPPNEAGWDNNDKARMD